MGRGLIRTFLEQRMTLGEFDQIMDRGMGLPSSAGISVTPQSALSVMAFYAGVRFIAGTMASLPLITYRRLANGGKMRAADHWLYPIMHDRANPEQTSMEWRETSIAHLVMRGNAYSEKETSIGGRLKALWPIAPDRVEVFRDDATQRLRYRVTLPGNTAQKKWLEQEQVLHLRGLSSNGVTGLNPIQIAREALGIAQATQEFAGRFFSNSITLSGAFETSKQLSDKAYKRLKADLEDNKQGLSNAQRFMILEEDLKWHQMGLKLDDAQFMEARKFQVEEIARMLNLPPHVLKSMERATNNNIEHQGLELVVYCLREWAVRIEQRFQMDLVPPEERDSIFIEFLMDGLLRGDWKSRSEALHIMRNDGIITRNEWRACENMNPDDTDGQGNAFLHNANMVAAGAEVDPAQPPGGGNNDPQGDTQQGG